MTSQHLIGVQEKTYDLLLAKLVGHVPIPRTVLDLGSGDAFHTQSLHAFKRRGVRELHLVDPMLRIGGPRVSRPRVHRHKDHSSAPPGAVAVASHPGFTISPDDQGAWWNRAAADVSPWKQTIDYLKPPVLVWCSFQAWEAEEEAELVAGWGYEIRSTGQPAESTADWAIGPGMRFCHTITSAVRTLA